MYTHLSAWVHRKAGNDSYRQTARFWQGKFNPGADEPSNRAAVWCAGAAPKLARPQPTKRARVGGAAVQDAALFNKRS